MLNSEKKETSTQTLFIEVILPVPLHKTFIYRLQEYQVSKVNIGSRVVVEFGKRRILTAIVKSITETPPKEYQAKYVLEVLGDTPTVTTTQIKLWEWISNYYVATIGEVMNAALPSGFKLSNQSKIQLSPDFQFIKEEIEEGLSQDEKTVLDTLESTIAIPYEKVGEWIGGTKSYQLINKLLAKKAIILIQDYKEKYIPKREKYFRINPRFLSDNKLEELLNALEKTPKQQEIILAYLKENPNYDNEESNENGIPLSTLKDKSRSSINTLKKKKIIEIWDKNVSRFDNLSFQRKAHQNELSEIQKNAFLEIKEGLKANNTTLLHGITGSGKTEVYINVISEVIARGKQALLMLPEIAITVQIIKKFKHIFGKQLGVYHSKYSDNERVETWLGVLKGDFKIIIGVRSSIFLPFTNLGLIVVDEEHEPSFKQHDPAPRYQARDVALYLAQAHDAKVILGSATPSLETYFHAQNQKFNLTELNTRYGETPLPEIKLIHLNKTSDTTIFSDELINQIKERLNVGEQTILFLNKRGFAHYLLCDVCKWTPVCANCSVSLTYHQYAQMLKCHYCGYTEKNISVCTSCGSTNIKNIGLGTEKVEDEIKLLFPHAKVERMDSDTMKSRKSYESLIQKFENQEIDILVGTQMLSKGLDFGKVTLVGVIGIDQMLYYPDFRANERVFQLITQVSGRAGRREKQGLVIIQTQNPKHPTLQNIVNQDYIGFYNQEIAERKSYNYPPFSRMIRIAIRSERREVVDSAAQLLYTEIKPILGEKKTLGPEYPSIDRIRNKYIKHIYLKLEKGRDNPSWVKEELKKRINTLEKVRRQKKFDIVLDVDFT